MSYFNKVSLYNPKARLRRLKQRVVGKTENDRKIKGLDLQTKMIENRNEWRKRFHVNNS